MNNLNNTNTFNIRDANRAFLNSLPHKIQCAVTLTFKQTRETYDRDGNKCIEKLTAEKIDKCAEQFMKRLNSRVLGSRSRHLKQSLFYIPVREKGRMSERLHLHIGIGKLPDYCNWFDLGKAIKKVIAKLEWIDEQIDFDPQPNPVNVVNYLTKTVTTTSDTILWDRTPQNMLS